MKIFVHTTFNHREVIRNAYARVVDVLKEGGVTVISNQDEEGKADITKAEVDRMMSSGENLIDKMEGIVIDASIPNPEVGYLLAYAISQKKPTLFLHETHSGATSAMSYFSGNKIPDTVMMRAYEIDQLRGIIFDFLQKIEGNVERDIPTIKFTLRVTPKIERFLTLKAKQHRTTKADYLREKVIKKFMEAESNK